MSKPEEFESLDDALLEIERLNLQLAKKDNELIEKESRCQQALRDANVVAYTTNLEGILLEVSDSVNDLFGISQKELIGKDVVSLYRDEKDRALLVAELKKNGTIKNYEVVLRNSQGEEYTCLVNANLVAGPEKNPIITGALTDVTEKREVVATLAKYKERLELAWKATTDGIFDWNIKEKKIFFSPNYYQMLGYEDREFVASYFSWTELLHPDDVERCTKFIRDYVSQDNPDPYHIEFRMRQKDGNYKWILGRGQIISRDEEGAPLRMLGTHVDIDQLKDTQGKLEEAYKVMDNFLGNMSHEIRTPLNGILTSIQLVELTKDPDSIVEYFGIIKESGDRLLSLMSDILEYSRLATGQVQISENEFSISDLAEKVEAEYHGRVIIDNHLPGTIMSGDPVRIDQVVDKIIDNALKYSDNKEVLISYSLSEAPESDEKFLSISIQDQGNGIPEEHQDLIFEKFRQGSEGYNRDYQGSGLGLSIAKTVADLMGADISLESEVGVGTKFDVRIPMKDYHIDERLNGKDYLEEICKYQILVVEDERTNALMLGRLLERTGIPRENISYAESAEEARSKISECRYRMVLMDIGLPGESGDALTMDLKNNGCSSLFVAVTANALPGDEVRYVTQGFDGYVPKPVGINRLQMAMTRAVRNSSN